MSQTAAKKKNPLPVANNGINPLVGIDPNMLVEVLYSPNEHFCIALNPEGFRELENYDRGLDGAAQQLEAARTEESNEHAVMRTAQNHVREQLHKFAEKTEQADDTATDENADPAAPPKKQSADMAPLTTGKAAFNEVIRVGEKKYSLVPAAFIEQYRSQPRHFFSLPQNIASTVNEVHREAPVTDSLRGWRHTEGDNAGQVNREKVKDVFGVVAKKMAKEWKLAEGKKSGQISSALLAKCVAPEIAAFFSDDDFAILDKWIEQINKDAKTSAHQYAIYRDTALKALDKKTGSKVKDANAYFLPEDWDLAQRMVKDIWGEKSAIYTKATRFRYQDIKDDQRRAQLRDEIAKLRLPPTFWDGSAGAQLMRYSLGATVKSEFDLLAKGKLALGAEAAFDIALGEAKAEGTCYFPSSEGYPLKPTITVKRETILFKNYGDSEKDNAFSDSALPQFAVDCCLLTPAGAAGVFNTLKAWSAIKETGHRAHTDLNRRDMFIQVVGHTSATGSESYNQGLGRRRAAIVADFITQASVNWIGHFKSGLWAEPELEFMAYCTFIDRKIIDAPVVWEEIGKINKKMPLVDQLKLQISDLEQRRERLLPEIQSTFFIPKSQWHEPERRQPQLTRLHFLIQQYLKTLFTMACKASHLTSSEGEALLKDIQLDAVPYISKGETEQRVQVASENADNRRCEFLAREIDRQKSTTESAEVEVYFGNLRGRIEGHMTAWAGANINLGGEIAVAAPKGVLTVVGAIHEGVRQGQVSEQTRQQGKSALTAGANAGAFAGAKAEIGLKMAVDWRSPSPQQVDKDNGQPYKPPAFAALGSVGYAVTGLAGIGCDGAFKVGFDETCGRFVIKVDAQAALGPGIGGKLDIVVGIGECWNFVTLIHGELKRNNFSYIDIFENEESESGIDVFALFSAWSWKMFKNGSPIGAAGALAIGLFAESAIELLGDARLLVVEWKNAQIINNQLDKLVETLKKKPELIKHLTPETKGRMLYELITAPYDLEERIDNATDFDLNKRREDAAIILIKEGTHSLIDWRETLEHMGEVQGGNFVPQVTSGATPEEKSRRFSDNLRRLQTDLLDDFSKWEALQQFINHLPETT